jgi:hypothetical protein
VPREFPNAAGMQGEWLYRQFLAFCLSIFSPTPKIKSTFDTLVMGDYFFILPGSDPLFSGYFWFFDGRSRSIFIRKPYFHRDTKNAIAVFLLKNLPASFGTLTIYFTIEKNSTKSGKVIVYKKG